MGVVQSTSSVAFFGIEIMGDWCAANAMANSPAPVWMVVVESKSAQYHHGRRGRAERCVLSYLP